MRLEMTKNSLQGCQQDSCIASTRSRRWRGRIPVRDGGGSLIEVALTLPALLMLVVAVSVYALFCYYAIEVSSAARTGVQYGMQNHSTASDNSGMQAAALKNGANVPGLTATAQHFCQCPAALGTNVSCTTACSGARTVAIEFVQVNTSATVNPLMTNPWMSGVSSITLIGKAVMRVQQ